MTAAVRDVVQRHGPSLPINSAHHARCRHNIFLDSAAIQEIYQYVKARSDAWLKPGRPHRLSDLQAKNKSP